MRSLLISVHPYPLTYAIVHRYAICAAHCDPRTDRRS